MPENGRPSSPSSWEFGVGFLVTAAVALVVGHFVLGDVGRVIGPVIGAALGVLVLRTRWARRFVARYWRSRWGAGPPADRWSDGGR